MKSAAFGPLVSAAWLRSHQAEPELCVIDLRWYLDGRSGREAFQAGHIPGAVFVDLEMDITGSTGPGRHPLPPVEQFEAAMRAAGVNGSSRVVVYDDQGGFSAARLWWLLRYHGHGQQAVLDGGLQAWRGELETGAPIRPALGNFSAATPDAGMVVDRDRVTRGGALLIDARAHERFTGESEPIDPRAGHIPGARNVPWRMNLREDWRFREPAALRRQYEEVGVGTGPEVVVYCGSGVSACVDLLAMAVAGLDPARLYPGSWSDWSRTSLPAESGESRSPTP